MLSFEIISFIVAYCFNSLIYLFLKVLSQWIILHVVGLGALHLLARLVRRPQVSAYHRWSIASSFRMNIRGFLKLAKQGFMLSLLRQSRPTLGQDVLLHPVAVGHHRGRLADEQLLPPLRLLDVEAGAHVLPELLSYSATVRPLHQQLPRPHRTLHKLRLRVASVPFFFSISFDALFAFASNSSCFISLNRRNQ